MRQRLSEQAYINGVLSRDRIVIGRAITLLESQLESDRELAQRVLSALLPYTGKSLRIGITGVPGVGKSTFIEAFGEELTSRNKSVAVLAIDPSSQRSGGSILGDKTRMEKLSLHPQAYIRPSPAGGTLGGVARKTRETMLLCEAAGYEYILIETVGVGQSETLVKGMVDFFVLLMLAGAGDELQGIKKGIMEMADLIVITKSDGANIVASQQAALNYQNALHLFPASDSGWPVQVVTCSATEKTGMREIDQLMDRYVIHVKNNGYFDLNRQNQQLDWMNSQVSESLDELFHSTPEVRAQLPMLSEMVKNGTELPLSAAQQLISLFLNAIKQKIQ